MLIIIAVIASAAAMQAAGGIDYMVMVAAKALRARPRALNFVAPYVSWLLTVLTGTGNTFFSLIPVINELAYANKIRPERALAGSAVASTFGITASPVAAAMATMLPLVEPFGFDIVDVMLITIPASLIGIFAIWLRIKFRKLTSADGMCCACNDRRLTSSSERKSPSAGLAFRQVANFHGSQSIGAVKSVR